MIEADLRGCDRTDGAANWQDKGTAVIHADDASGPMHSEQPRGGPAQSLGLGPEGVEEVEGAATDALPFVASVWIVCRPPPCR